MKTTFALFLILTTAAALPAATKKKTPAKTETAAAPTYKPLVIPSDATPNPDGTYSYTDKAGKKWVFSKTPFGISRIEDMGASATATTVSKEQFITATDSGDTVKFVRKTPFGETKWEKKKTDLTDEERRVLAAQSTQQ